MCHQYFISTLTIKGNVYAQCTMSYAPTRHPHHHASNMTPSSTLSVSPLCSFIDQLIESWIDIICELYLRNRFHPLRGTTNGEANDALFAQWRIEHSFRTKIFCEIHATAKDASECYILTEHKGTFVCAKGVCQGAVDGLEDILAGGCRIGEGRVSLKRRRAVMKEGVGSIIDWNVQTGIWRMGGVWTEGG